MTPRAARRPRRRLLLLVPLLAIPGCSLLGKYTRPPRVDLQSVQMKGLSFDWVDLVADLKITNRYPVEVPVPRISYGVDIEGKTLLDGMLEKKVTLPSSQASQPYARVKVPVRVATEKVYQVSAKYKTRDEAPYRLHGTVNIDTPVGPVSVPFEHKGTFPVLKVPQIDMPELQVKSLGMQGADLRLKFRIRNPNNLALSLKRMNYQIEVSGSKIANGSLPSWVNLAPKAQNYANMDVHVGLQEVGTALQTILSKQTLAYRLTGDLTVGTKWGDLKTPLKGSGVANIKH